MKWKKPPIACILPFVFLLIVAGSFSAIAQPAANMDEAQVGRYTLPPLLRAANGKQIKTANEWERVQRPHLLRLFAENVYGRMPGKPVDMHFALVKTDALALNGKATRKEVIIHFTNEKSGPSLTVLLYLPNRTTGKVPVFVGLNFEGNHTVQKDTAITVTDRWKSLHPNGATIERGDQDRRWPVEELIEAGYGLATAWYQDLEADNPDGWKTGIRTTLQESLKIRPDEWGAVAAWGWGLSRMMDYLETDPKVNAKEVVLTGHSRLGKAALWAAANDQRFALVVSNNAGEGGAALARRNFGETVERVNTAFPHWFVAKYKTYNNAVDRLPVDQHELLALMAPRPLYVASATEDSWADPKGEFLSAKEAGKVYALYGLKGIKQNEQPPADTPVGDWVMYHLRTGKHDMILYDWQQYRLFADRVFKRKEN